MFHVKRSGPPRRRRPLRQESRKGSDRRERFRRVRGQVLRRDGFRCQADVEARLLEAEVPRADWPALPGCEGAPVNARLHAHHLRKRSQGGKDTPGNLLTVCLTCHDWIHHNERVAALVGLIRRAGWAKTGV